MTIRGDILELIVLGNGAMERTRIIQTLEILQHTSPFTTPKHQGDDNNECTILRRWINQVCTPHQISIGEMIATCPFPKELDIEGFRGMDGINMDQVAKDWEKKCLATNLREAWHFHH